MVGADAVMAAVTGAGRFPSAPPEPAGNDPHVARLARGGAVGLFGAVASAVLTLSLTVLVTRSLSAVEAGTFFSATSAFLIAYAVASVGTPTGVVYFLARARATGDIGALRVTTRHALVVAGGFSLALAGVGMFLAPSIAQLIAPASTQGTILVRVLSAALVAAVLNDVAVGVTRGYDTMRPFVLVERLGRPVAQTVLAVAVVVSGGTSALWLGAAWAAPYVLGSAVLLSWARRLRRRTEASATGGLEVGRRRLDRRAFWSFTGPRSLAAISQMVLQRADIVLLGALAGPAPAAVYTAATRFLVFGQLGAGAISTTMQPRIAALVAIGDADSVRSVYRAGTTWLVLLAWPAYLLSAVFAPELLLVFGDAYPSGSGVVILLSCTMLVATACGAVDVVLTMAGRSTWTMANSLAALALNLLLNVLLIPSWGILGAAVAWSGAILVRNLLPLVQLAHRLGLHPFGRSTALACSLSLLCTGAAPASTRWASGGSLTLTAVAAVVGVMVYATLVHRWRLLLGLPTIQSLRGSSHG